MPKTPMEIRVEEHAKTQRNTMRKVKIKDTVCRNLWRELVYPLRRERAKVQTSIQYYAANPDADQYQRETNEAYLALLVKMEDKLTAWRTLYADKTPKQMAKEKGVDNCGSHWSDWVPANIRDHFLMAYQYIDATRKSGRARTPFERTPAPPKPKRPRRVSKAPSETACLTPIEELRDRMKALDDEMLRTTDPHEKETIRLTIIALRTEQDELRKERSRRRAAAYYLAQKTKHANIRRQVREKLEVRHGVSLQHQPHGETYGKTE